VTDTASRRLPPKGGRHPDTRAYMVNRGTGVPTKSSARAYHHDCATMRWSRADLAHQPGRAVYVLHEGGDTLTTVLCECCIPHLADPAAAMATVIRRDDFAHCVGCDYHADPDCGPENWCAAAADLPDDVR
jgi:hypothetical protein